MQLFESYDRRIAKINSVLAQYQIASLEEARQMCKSQGFDPYELAEKFSQFVLKMLNGHMFWALQLR